VSNLVYVIFVAMLYSSSTSHDLPPFSDLKFFLFLGYDSNSRDSVDSLRLMHGFLLCVPFLVLQIISTTTFTPMATLVAGCFNICLLVLLFQHEVARWIAFFRSGQHHKFTKRHSTPLTIPLLAGDEEKIPEHEHYHNSWTLVCLSVIIYPFVVVSFCPSAFQLLAFRLLLSVSRDISCPQRVLE